MDTEMRMEIMDCNPTICKEKLTRRQSKWKERFPEKSTL